MNPEYLEALWSMFFTLACFMAAASDMLTMDATQGSSDNVDNSIAIYDELLRANPNLTPVHTCRGLTLASMKDYPRAIEDFDALIRLHPDEASYYTLRAMAFHELNRVDETIADCTEAIKLAPKESGSYVLRAISWMQKRDFKKAIEDLDEVIRRNPDDASFLVTRSQIFLASGQLDKAKSDVRKAIRMDPKQITGLTLHAQLALQNDDYDSALADCNRILELNPRNTEIRRGRVGIYYRQLEYGLALADALEIVELDCRQILINSIEDLARRSMSQSDQVLKLNDVEASETKRIATAHLDRALALMTLKLADPIAELAAAIALNPDLTRAYAIRGQLWLDQGEPSRAIDDFNVLLRKCPDDAKAWAGRGMAYAARRDWRQACDDFTAALSLDPDLVRVKVQRGIAWQALEEWQLAIADFKDVTKGSAFYVRDLERLKETASTPPASTKTTEKKPKQTESSAGMLSDTFAKMEMDLTKLVEGGSEWKAYLDKEKKAENGKNETTTASTSDTATAYYPVKLDPNYIESFLRLGECYEARDEWQKALDVYFRLVQVAPDEARAYRRLAWALGTCPDDRFRSGEQAIGYAWKAMDRVHVDDEIGNLIVLAAVYSELGDFDRAIQFQAQAQTATAAASEKELQDRQQTLVALEFQRSLDGPDPASFEEQQRRIKTLIKKCQQTNWTSVADMERLADAYASAGELEAAQHCQETAQHLKVQDKDKPLAERLARYQTGVAYRDQGTVR